MYTQYVKTQVVWFAPEFLELGSVLVFVLMMQIVWCNWHLFCGKKNNLKRGWPPKICPQCSESSSCTSSFSSAVSCLYAYPSLHLSLAFSLSLSGWNSSVLLKLKLQTWLRESSRSNINSAAADAVAVLLAKCLCLTWGSLLFGLEPLPPLVQDFVLE